MNEELENKARKRVEAKKAFYLVAVIFAFTSLILLVLSFFFPYPVSFWVRFPIVTFPLVLAILYVPTFGLPFSRVGSEEWEEEEYEKELDKLYRENRSKLSAPEELSEEDRLELRELDRLKRKWENDEEDYYV